MNLWYNIIIYNIINIYIYICISSSIRYARIAWWRRVWANFRILVVIAQQKATLRDLARRGSRRVLSLLPAVETNMQRWPPLFGRRLQDAEAKALQNSLDSKEARRFWLTVYWDILLDHIFRACLAGMQLALTVLLYGVKIESWIASTQNSLGKQCFILGIVASKQKQIHYHFKPAGMLRLTSPGFTHSAAGARWGHSEVKVTWIKQEQTYLANG